MNTNESHYNYEENPVHDLPHLNKYVFFMQWLKLWLKDGSYNHVYAILQK